MEMTTTTLAPATNAHRPLPDRWLVRPAVRELEREEWARAASFVERVEGHRERGSLPGLFAGALARGARPEQRWLSLVPFSCQRLFARRLAVDGVSEQEFRAILGGAAAPGGGRGDQAPPWLARWLAAYARDPVPGAVPVWTGEPTGAASDIVDVVNIVDVIEPVLSDARARLAAGIKQLAGSHDDCPFDPATAEGLLLLDLPARLAHIATRTLNLELQVADLRGDLRGARPAERRRSFIDGLCQREAALAFFREYPLLARQLSDCIEHWAAAGLEFLRHLCEDWTELRGLFNGGGEPGRLAAAEVAVGAQRRGGRATLIARFASGLQLAYKPRPVALDVHFQSLLAWINRRGAGFDYRTLLVLDRGDHGWLEHVAASPCASAAALERRHWREGGYLALRHAFDATNFHDEDLMAAGEQPMLLEPEVLFQSSPPIGQLVADESASPRDHLGKLENLEHFDAVDVGFKAMVRLLAEHRDELLADDGPLARFADDDMRVMARPASTYEHLLREACHPDAQRDALDRDRLFDRLWLAVENTPGFDPLVAAEQADLRRGDIPAFLGRPGSVDLRHASGTCFAGLLPEPALERVRRRLLSLGEPDRAPPTG
jgi:hypothetical protein